MRKKLFAILMSAMMMVTFMPAMAFAAISYVSPVWNDDYSHVDYTVSGDAGSPYQDGCDAVRYADASGNAWDGTVTAYPKNTGVNSAVYMDLDFAKVAKIGSTTIPATGRMTLAQAKAMFGSDFTAKTVAASKLTFAVPTYVKDYNTALSKTKVVGDLTKDYELGFGNGKLPGIAVNVEVPAYDASKMYTEDQSFELNVTSSVKSWSEGYFKFIGHPAKLKITIVKETAKVADAAYKFDNKVALSTNNQSVNFFYDGNEHELAQLDMPGITSTYQVYSAADHKYVAVDKVVVKDAKTYEIKATATDGKTKNTKTFYVTVQKAPYEAKFGFVDTDVVTSGVQATYKVAADYNAADFIEVVKGDNEGNNTSVGLTRAEAWAKAVKADEETLKAYFNEKYQIKTTERKFEEGTFDAVIVNLYNTTMTAAEKTAFDTKWAGLEANYDFDGIASNASVAVFKVTGSEIDWVKAPLTKKYYNKKGTLKKTYTFQVEAKSEAKVTYKLQYGGEMIKIDKNTGKVTVKKGLKVGTYKVLITAKSGSAEDAYYLTIQMAKKK